MVAERLSEDRSSVLERGVETFGQTQTSRPVLCPLQEVSGILELAMGIDAGFFARDRVVAFASRKCRYLALARHFEPVMIYDALGDAFTTDKDAVIAQDHERTSIEVSHQFWRHVVIELEAFKFVILQFAIEPKCMLIDWQ